MRVIYSFILICVFSLTTFAGNLDYAFYHDVPMNIVKGENARFEITLNGSNTFASEYRDVQVLYRELGGDRYKTIDMKEEGFSYFANLNTKNINTGQIEYYFAFRDRFGNVKTLPGEMPQMNPYKMNIIPEQVQTTNANFEIVILSPELNEAIPDNEVIVAASVLGGETEIDFDQSRLFIDGVNVSSLAEFDNGIVTFVPENIREGRHNIELQLYNNDGELIQNKEWAFRAVKSGMNIEKVNYRGSFFLDNRSQTIAQNSDNFFTGGGYFAGNYSNLDFYSKLIVSSEESDEIQPVNRYTAELRYHFSPFNNIYLKGGDFTPYYNPLVFQDRRVRGIQTGLEFGFFTFDFLYGQTNRAIEGFQEINIATNDTLTSNGVYSENIIAYRPGFRFGENVQWNLNLVNAKQDGESIEFGGNVKESVVFGTDLSMNFDKRRVTFEGSFQASIQNSDAGGPELVWEDLVKIDSSLADNSGAESAFNFIKNSGFLSATAGLNPLPSFAMQFDLYLRYFRNNFKVSYLSINRDFAAPGNPYLLKDIKGLYLFDNVRLFENQVFLNLFFKTYQNNLSDDQYSTDNSEIGATVSYFPAGNYPSVTLGYTSYSRSNGVTEADTASMPYLYIEDNSTQQINFSSSYNLYFDNIKNTLLLNLTNYVRDDVGNSLSNSSFNSFTIGVRSTFDFPLTTKLSFTQSSSEVGDTVSTTDISRYNLNVDYKFFNLFDVDILKPFFNLSIQSLDYGKAGTTDRNNYAGGLIYQSSNYGIFSLKYYQISYKNVFTDKTINDNIFNVRYEYLF
jgi:hypothetical protein